MSQKILMLAFVALALTAATIYAQGDGAPPPDKASQALEADNQGDAESAFFGDEQAMAETEAPTQKSGLDQFLKNDQGVRWGGSVKSDIGWNGGWSGAGKWIDPADLNDNWNDGFSGDLEGKFYLDARPEKAYRVKLALKSAWPFDSLADAYSPVGDSVSVPNIKLWEMFADLNIDDAVFVRIGKQVASWGLLGSAYSPSDVISLSPKDVTDLGAEREGPLALKLSVPANAWNANFSGLVIMRDEYLGSNPTWRDLGYAARGEALLGYTELSLGAFYQREAAPKLVGTLTSGLGFLGLPVIREINIFSESALSWGSDKQLGSGLSPSGAFASLDKPSSGLFYQGTIGASYANSSYNFSLSAEYFYNGLGSNSSDYAKRAFTTLYVPAGSGGLMKLGDALEPGMHNLTAILTFTKIDNSKFGSMTIWQQNFSDASGWVRERISFTPWDYVSFYVGADLVYGEAGTEFAMLHQDPISGLAKHITFFLGTTVGTGSF